MFSNFKYLHTCIKRNQKVYTNNTKTTILFFFFLVKLYLKKKQCLVKYYDTLILCLIYFKINYSKKNFLIRRMKNSVLTVKLSRMKNSVLSNL